MEAGNKAIYNGQFQGNVLVVGKIGSGKTYLLQKLALNKFFRELVKTESVTGIKINEQREAEVQTCFSIKVKLHQATDPDELTKLTEKFRLRTREIVNNEKSSGFSEKI